MVKTILIAKLYFYFARTCTSNHSLRTQEQRSDGDCDEYSEELVCLEDDFKLHTEMQTHSSLVGVVLSVRKSSTATKTRISPCYQRNSRDIFGNMKYLCKNAEQI